MELLDVCDKDGNLLNKTIVRGEGTLNDDEYIRLVLVWIESKGKYLIQKCSEGKGSEFAITGGHVTHGVMPIDQVVTECKEELDIDIDKNELEYLGTEHLPHAIFYVYYYRDDSLEGKNFHLQESEVAGVKFYTKEEFETLMQTQKVRGTTIKSYDKFIKNKAL